MTIVSLAEAQATLPELLEKLGPGEEVTITRDNQPIAKLVHRGRCGHAASFIERRLAAGMLSRSRAADIRPALASE